MSRAQIIMLSKKEKKQIQECYIVYDTHKTQCQILSMGTYP